MGAKICEKTAFQILDCEGSDQNFSVKNNNSFFFIIIQPRNCILNIITQKSFLISDSDAEGPVLEQRAAFYEEKCSLCILILEVSAYFWASEINNSHSDIDISPQK